MKQLYELYKIMLAEWHLMRAFRHAEKIAHTQHGRLLILCLKDYFEGAQALYKAHNEQA